MIKFVTNPLFEFCILMAIACGISWNVHKHEARLTLAESAIEDGRLTETEDVILRRIHDSSHDNADEALTQQLLTVKGDVELLRHDLTAMEKRTVFLMTPSPVASPSPGAFRWDGMTVSQPAVGCNTLCIQ